GDYRHVDVGACEQLRYRAVRFATDLRRDFGGSAGGDVHHGGEANRRCFEHGVDVGGADGTEPDDGYVEVLQRSSLACCCCFRHIHSGALAGKEDAFRTSEMLGLHWYTSGMYTRDYVGVR